MTGEDIFGSGEEDNDGVDGGVIAEGSGEVCKRQAAAAAAESADAGGGATATSGSTSGSASGSVSCCCQRCSRGRSRPEVARLRECWCRVRADVCAVFRLVMDSAWNDSNRERPGMRFNGIKLARFFFLHFP